MRRLRRSLVAAAAASALTATTAAAAVQVSQSGWQWGNPTPQGNTLRASDFNAGVGYAIGDAGTALRTDDGGETWLGLATGTSQNLQRVQVVTRDVVIILGGDGCVVRRSDDGGRTFRKIYVLAEISCPEPVAAVHFVDPSTGYLFLRNGNVLRTTDAGETFSRQTAVPGTQGSTGGGNAVPADAMFATPDAGLVFIANTNIAYRTTDAGISWTQEKDVDTGSVQRVRRLDGKTAFAFGPDTLLRTTDGGETWVRRGAGAGVTVTGISCATADLCLLTTEQGSRILRTENGGGTAEPITASTQALFTAGFQSPTRAVALGVGGSTVVSDDGGRNYRPIGGDIAGSFPFGLRLGPAANIAFALGARGQLARTDNGGVTWRAVNVATSADMQDASFSSATEGYALDQRGGLFRTQNGGQSWSTLDPGTTSPPRAVITSGDFVLLAGPRGIRRGTGGERFDAVDSRAARRAAVDKFDRAGSALFAYGTTTAIRSANRGASWSVLPLPGRKGRRGRLVPYRIQDLEMTSATKGYVLDLEGRVWFTTNGGRLWRESAGVGTNRGLALAFGSESGGYLTLSGFAADTGASYVLRTSDGGRTWRPQRIATGTFPGTEGVISPTSSKSYALTSTPAAGNEIFRSLFFTDRGGDAGSPSQLTLEPVKAMTKRQLRREGGRISVKGTLRGAQGGERIVVSARSTKSSRWTSQVVQAGANGGSFTARFRAGGSTLVVAQWAGDSGRQGAGTRVLGVRVK